MNSLSRVFDYSETYRGWQIIALTRSVGSAAAQALFKLPRVQMLEKDWTLIDAEWLREHNVVRAFIASHNGASAFANESLLLTAMLEAGVKYVVRISTTPANIGPATGVHYARTHWAIENLLSQPEFENLQWSSLQPNVFPATVLGSAVTWFQKYRETGKQEPSLTMFSADAPVALIDGGEVGKIAAILLTQEDIAPHNRARYRLNGPQDVTGRELVALVEGLAGVKIDEAHFQDMSFFDGLAKAGFPLNIVASLRNAAEPALDGRCSSEAMPTSKEIMGLAAPTVTPAKAFEAMLRDLK